MTEYDNTNRFALFKNDRKRDDKDSDYNGTVNIDGVEYWLNGWLKEGQKGKFFSGTVKPKQPQAAPQRARRENPISSGRLPPKQSIMPDDDDRDVPF